MTKEEIIKRAKEEIGTTEYPPNSNNVKYNTWYYGHPVSGANYPWCAAFISWLFRDTNYVKRTALCADMLTWFEQNHRVVSTPQEGDICFMKFKTNNRKTNHVGLVIGTKGSTAINIEGNTSINSDDNGGKVMVRERSKNIVAYGRPAYSNAGTITPAKSNISTPTVTIRQGAKGEPVRLLQQLLITKGYFLTIDGDFGPKTLAAVKDFQNKQHLVVDGIVGPKTWAALIG